MMDRTHNVRAATSMETHTRVETVERDHWAPDQYYRIQRLDARRCPTHYEGDQAQIEIQLTNCDYPKKRATTAYASMILTPQQARALALAICPELNPSNLPVNE